MRIVTQLRVFDRGQIPEPCCKRHGEESKRAQQDRNRAHDGRPPGLAPVEELPHFARHPRGAIFWRLVAVFPLFLASDSRLGVFAILLRVAPRQSGSRRQC